MLKCDYVKQNDNVIVDVIVDVDVIVYFVSIIKCKQFTPENLIVDSAILQQM